MAPRRVEAHVDGAVVALRGVGVVAAGVGDVLLRDGGEVGDGVGDAVGAAEGQDDARGRGCVRQRDVAARVRQQWPRVPRLDQLEVLEVLAARRAREGFLDAETQVADAVGDIDYARELFEVGEKLRGDGAVRWRLVLVLLGERHLLS